MTAKELAQLLKENDYSYDPWGARMEAMFCVAEILTFVYNDCPTVLQYSPNACKEPDTENSFYEDFKDLSKEDLVEIALALNSISDKLKNEGKDY